MNGASGLPGLPRLPGSTSQYQVPVLPPTLDSARSLRAASSTVWHFREGRREIRVSISPKSPPKGLYVEAGVFQGPANQRSRTLESSPRIRPQASATAAADRLPNHSCELKLIRDPSRVTPRALYR